MQTGWLSPTGEFISCEPYNHIDVARNITGSGYDADVILQKQGWVQISRYSLGNREQKIYYDLHHSLTPEQIRFLRPYFEENDIPTDEICILRWKYEVM